jgi:hypothetical protein
MAPQTPISSLNLAEPDPCCGKALSKALASGALDRTDFWTHDKCGCEWRAEAVGGVRYWIPIVIIARF